MFRFHRRSSARVPSGRGGSLLFLAAIVPVLAQALRSGPQPGDRLLPFTSTMVTGPYRGQQHCYICELKDEPAVLVFARSTHPTTALLLRRLLEQLRAHRKEQLFAWFVFLARDRASEPALEAAAYDFARANGATRMPVSALGDPQGPPGYLIAPEAEVTVLLFRGKKVVANHAFRTGEWNEKAVEAVLKELPGLLAAGT
jgi:hypothetical protein